jgi:hypothetical protein
VRDIQQDLLPHPLSPFLPSLGMTRWTESTRLAGKHQQPLFPAVGTPDAGKAAHRIAAVQILIDNILDDWPKEAVFLLKTILIFSEEPLKIIKEYPIKKRMFRMTWAVDPCHGRGVYSRNGPGSRKEPQRSDTPGMLH